MIRKAVIQRAVGGPEVLKWEIDSQAMTAGPRQVVVEIAAAGVNPVDTYIRSGAQGYAPASLPWTLGSDAAGVVVSCGPKSRWAVGQRVVVLKSPFGTHASHTVCEDDDVLSLPDSCSFEAGACLGVPYGTAWHALFHRGQLRPGETVLVHGASGGVGVAALQLARFGGASLVVGTASRPDTREKLLQLGADHALPHSDVENALRLSGGRGFDVIVEMLADANLPADARMVAPRGRILVVGSRGPVLFAPRDLMRPEADIRGVALRSMTPAERQSTYLGVLSAVQRGVAAPAIAASFPFSEAEAAHLAVYERSSVGKIVLLNPDFHPSL